MQKTAGKLKEEVRICQQCGQPYEPKAPNQKYCSRHCSDLHNKRPQKAQKICPTCCTSFMTSYSWKAYCSEVCQRGAYRTRKGWTQTKIEWKNIREFVLERDDFTCQNCGCFLMDMGLEVHHIKPLYRGGANSEKNLIALCHKCHKRRHSTGWRKDAHNRK